MKISIRHNGDYVIEFDQFTVSGREAAGGYGFNFVFKGSRQGRENPLLISDISLSLSLSDPIKPIATMIPSSTQIIQCHNFPNNGEQLNFEIILAGEQINFIEEQRQENDLVLNIALRALTSANNTVWPSFDSSDAIVSREHWLRALKSSGFRQTVLFELPLPPVTGELSELISKAQEFIETGHYKDAVMQCRHIIEQIETSRGDKNLSVAANKMAQVRDKREEMTAIERMLSLREQLKNVCHLGAHSKEKFTRSQAKSMLGITIALLAEPTVGFTKTSTLKTDNDQMPNSA